MLKIKKTTKKVLIGILVMTFALCLTWLLAENNNNSKLAKIAEKQKIAKDAQDKKTLKDRLESLSLPDQFSLSKESFKPAFHGKLNLGTEDCLFSCQIDYGASLTVNYQINNLNREQVFQTFVHALGLNPADHAHSTDQRLNGNKSPIYPGTFDLTVEPFDDFSSEWSKSCYEADQQVKTYESPGSYDNCIDRLNGLRAANSAEFTMELPY